MPSQSSSPASQSLDGKKLSALLGDHLKQELTRHSFPRVPGLGVVLVGDNPASLSYIKRKEAVAEATGFRAFDFRFPATVEAHVLSKKLQEIAAHPEIDGVLLQLPLPGDLDAHAMILELGSEVDADGLHPFHQGATLLGLRDCPRPCTPLGVMSLIDLAFWHRHSQLVGAFPAQWPLPHTDLSGKRAVVIGRSDLVGKPVAMMLLERNATVSVLHSRTLQPATLCAQADIVVAAVGKPGLVTKEWIKPGAIVIDVGINRLPSGKLTGDVAYDEVAPLCAAITPVPGGVGPMTVAMLLWNTWQLFLRNMRDEGVKGVAIHD